MSDVAAPTASSDGPDLRARLAVPVLFLGAMAIAFSPIFVRLSEVGPTVSAFWRTGLAVPLLLVLAVGEAARAGRRFMPGSGRDVLYLAIPGFFFAGDLAFWHWSLDFTSVANATLFANLAPIFVTLGAWAIFRERFTLLFLAGLATALTGAVVLMGESLAIAPGNLFGDALGLTAAVFYGSYILAIGRLRPRFSTFAVMFWSSVGTAVFLFPVGLLSGEAWFPATLEGWAVLVGLAWISHAAGGCCIAWSLAHLPAAFSSVSLLLQPVMATILAWILLAESLGWLQGLGGAVVLAGILLARRGALRRRAAPPA